MEHFRFDRLVRAIGVQRSRRAAIALLGGLVTAPNLADRDAEAKPRKKRKKKCKAPKQTCGGKCVSIQTDDANCGACGSRCGGTQSCRNGQCAEIGCTPGQDNQACNGEGRCRGDVCQPRPVCHGNGVTFRQGDGECCSGPAGSCDLGPTYIECTCFPGATGRPCLANGDCTSGRCIGYQCTA